MATPQICSATMGAVIAAEMAGTMAAEIVDELVSLISSNVSSRRESSPTVVATGLRPSIKTSNGCCNLQYKASQSSEFKSLFASVSIIDPRLS